MISSIQLQQAPTAFSTDIQGNIYLGFRDGTMSKFDPLGQQLQTYSLSNLSSITLLEAQNSLKIFLFYFDNQQITILDRFSSIPKSSPLSELKVNLAMLACPAPDGHFWVIENNPQRLQKIDPIRRTRIMEVQTSFGNELKYMRAYQNLLIISDENGLYIYDQYGTKINMMKGITFSHFQMHSDLLYGLMGNTIYQINPFKGEIESKLVAPVSDAITALKTKSNFAFVHGQKLTIYRLLND